MIYALDSNIISYFLKKNNEVMKRFQNAMDNNNPYVIPPLVYYEVKRWLVVRNATSQLQDFSKLYNDSIKSDMTPEIWEKAIELYIKSRQAGKPIDDADIFIGAYCIINNYVLVTNNTKHFKDIDGLSIENWVTAN